MRNKIPQELIVRYLSNECSTDEKKYLEENMKADPHLKDIVERLRVVWNMEREKIVVEDVDYKWLQLQKVIESDLYRSHKSFGDSIRNIGETLKAWLWDYPVSIKYAFAVILIIIGAFFVLSQKPLIEKESSVEFLTIKVQKGKRTIMNLSDGTKVTLDACSELKFPAVFGETRDVYLEGEGYFEVAKDSEHPFRVHAKSALVNVVGTKFNVRSWDDNPKVTVTVLEGKVILSNEEAVNNPGVYLTRGKQSSISELGQVLKPINVNAKNYIKWMNNEIIFKEAHLKEILNQLERWYGYNFIIDDELIANQTMSVHIRKANVNEVLNVISMITNTKTIRDGKTIRFVKKHNKAA